jgi:hypothetical protein
MNNMNNNTRTRAERLATANEVKLLCIEHQLSDDVGTRVLYLMLDKYVDKGETYLNKEIRLTKRYDRPRYYLVNLYNDKAHTDTVIIKSRD